MSYFWCEICHNIHCPPTPPHPDSVQDEVEYPPIVENNDSN